MSKNISRLELPILVAGERLEHTGDVVRTKYDDDTEVAVPALRASDVERMLATDRAPLRNTSIDDITIFFDQVGKAWRDPENRWRKIALEWGTRTTGYAARMVEWDVNLLGGALQRSKQYDTLEHDLGDPGLLDEWTRTKAIYQRCFPKGLIAHVMVGNVPMASLFTLYRSLTTKNVTVAKLPRRDLVTSLCFAQCIHDTDPTHPVARALSAVYWEPGSAAEQAVLDGADVVSVWGQERSVAAIKSRLRPGTELIEFGPKRSLAVVLPGERDWDKVGMKMAYDVICYDQEGCFSLQEVYVVGREVEPLVEALSRWLAHYAEAVPRRRLSDDAEAHIQRARIEAETEGWRVVGQGATDFTVVVTDGAARIAEHPLCRFVYVHPVRSLDDVLENIDRNVQTVSVTPWDRLWEVADQLAFAGADRIVQVGRMARMRPGFNHDGFHPMRRMVRWAAIERGLDYKYRFMSTSAEEDEERIYRQTRTSAH